MGHFLASEKTRQVSIKKSDLFSRAAWSDGAYKNHAYPFCLPVGLAAENLYTGIRAEALNFFDRHEIKWHDGGRCRPSNHLGDSQVCCVNFLFPFSGQPAALARLLRPVFPELTEMLPVEDGRFVTFEWIGLRNYLNEKIGRSGKRSRGANFTSADAALLFLRSDGLRQMVLIEWKYTETYGSTFLKTAPSGTSRAAIYAHLFAADDCPLDKAVLPCYDALFYEPFYQLMRQQLLANEMERARELGADRVSLLHISPAHNRDFQRVTSPWLVELGGRVTDVWKRIVRDQSRFTSVSTEDLFGSFDPGKHSALQSWHHYITTRYSWLTEKPLGTETLREM